MSARPDRLTERPARGTDPLSDLLALADVDLSKICRLYASGGWGLRFPGVAELRVGVMVEGAMVLSADDSHWQPVTAGDCFVIASDRAFTIAADEYQRPADALPLLEVSPEVLHLGRPGQPEVHILATAITVPAPLRLRPALTATDVTHVPAADPRAASVSRLVRLLADTVSADPVDHALREQVSRALVVQIVRVLDAEIAAGAESVERRRHDSIHDVVGLIHRNPERDWTVESLAAAAHLSRSSFAKQFADLLGAPPLTYLTQLRMHLARQALRAGASVGATAKRVGYASDSSFSRGYKRTFGVSPVDDGALRAQPGGQ